MWEFSFEGRDDAFPNLYFIWRATDRSKSFSPSFTVALHPESRSYDVDALRSLDRGFLGCPLDCVRHKGAAAGAAAAGRSTPAHDSVLFGNAGNAYPSLQQACTAACPGGFYCPGPWQESTPPAQAGAPPLLT